MPKTSLRLLPESPREIGLPHDNWRNGQDEVIEGLLFSRNRHRVVCAATGFGKTLCIVADSKLQPGRSVILTTEKGLQDQLPSQYPGERIAVLKGKRNYECMMKRGWDCGIGHAVGCTARLTGQCPSVRATVRARNSERVIMNYALWLSQVRSGVSIGPINRIYMDEGHAAPTQLADSLQVRATEADCKALGIKFPKVTHDSGTWRKWSISMTLAAGRLRRKLLARLQNGEDRMDATLLNRIHEAREMGNKYRVLATMSDGDWVWERFDWGWEFNSTNPSKYAESYLHRGAEAVTLVSATARPKTAEMINMTDPLLFDIPSSFDPSRSPIYALPAQRVDNGQSDLRTLIIFLDQYLTRRQGLNTIIQVTSHEYRDKIVAGSRYGHLMKTNLRGKPIARVVQEFRQRGGIIISPSVGTGYDFPGDQCRLILVTKVPFPQRTKINLIREELDPEYGSYVACQSLTQWTGRGTRDDPDWCESAILDAHFSDWFFRKNSSMFARWWRERIRHVLAIPPPLRF